VARLVSDLAGIDGAPFRGRALADAPLPDADDVAISEVSRRRGVPTAWPTASGGLRSIQTARYQLIVSETGRLELFDLVADPAQARNLASDAASAGIASGLRERLAREIDAAASRASIR
jgi:hypothetical protein